MAIKLMKTWEAMGPSGPMQTMAYTYEKAMANLRWRLHAEYGMSWFSAREYDLTDMREVVPK